MPKNRYIYTTKRHSKRSIMAAILGGISLVSLIYVIWLAYTAGGHVKQSYGFAGMFAALFSVTGFIISVYSVRQKDWFKIFPILGIVFNSFSLILLVIILELAWQL